MRNPLWAEKYRPLKYTDLVFKGDAHHRALKWLRDYPNHGRILLINGPPGTGKTSLVHILSSVFGLNLVELNASDGSGWIDKILNVYGTVDGKKNLILIDEIDDNPSVDVESLISSTKLIYPVVMTSNEMHLENIYTVEVKRPRIDEVKKCIERICKEEMVNVDNSTLLQLVEDFDGDYRAIINHLQMHKQGLASSKDLRVGKSVPTTKHKAAELILTKHMGWRAYEDVYSADVLSLCHSSFPYNTNLMRLIADISESTSLADILAEEFRYMALSKYNGCNSRRANIQVVEHYREPIRDLVKERILPYFRKYDLSRTDRKSLSHLKEMMKMYNIVDVKLKEEDRTEESVGKGSRKFKFRYKPGCSSAFRRDVTMDDIIDWFFKS